MQSTRRALLGAVGVGVGFAGCLGDGTDENGEDDQAAVGDTDQEDDEPNGTDGEANGDTVDSNTTVGVREQDEHGPILVGPDGVTLYMFDEDDPGGPESTCVEDCAEHWPPLTVEDDPVVGQEVKAAMSTIERDDGSQQVTANSWPLYEWHGDETPGDATGQGVDDAWWVLEADGTPIRDGEDNGSGRGY